MPFLIKREHLGKDTTELDISGHFRPPPHPEKTVWKDEHLDSWNVYCAHIKIVCSFYGVGVFFGWWVWFKCLVFGFVCLFCCCCWGGYCCVQIGPFAAAPGKNHARRPATRCHVSLQSWTPPINRHSCTGIKPLFLTPDCTPKTRGRRVVPLMVLDFVQLFLVSFAYFWC